ncbi:hypothetical protein ACFFKU_14005 [Kineococcus gynurae]|uniref:Uncharacterized protein n=1 Tax=Kineococcus gynurae TaxID=452979 RepID=A0ABV5LU26_9ACTN
MDLVRYPGLWEAFLLVAPYAYDAQALDAGGAEVLHLSDAGDLRVVLAPQERREVEALIGAHRLVPVEPRRPWWVRWRERLLSRDVR